MGVKVYDRQTGELYEEKQVSAGYLSFLYSNPAGRILLKAVSRPLFSKLYAMKNNSRRSVKSIEPFISEFGIDMSCCEARKFSSFDDFFARRPLPGARPVCSEKNAVVSPADSKVAAYKISDSLCVKIKGTDYTVPELLRDGELARKFIGGTCLVFRLTVDNIHRYIWCADGSILYEKKLSGLLHSVGPMSEGRVKALSENQREYCVFSSDTVGEAVQLEVGALTVGKIENNHIRRFPKGDEKGCFRYGGSTVVLLFGSGRVEVDEDILSNSARGIETAVKMGEKIGEKGAF